MSKEISSDPLEEIYNPFAEPDRARRHALAFPGIIHQESIFHSEVPRLIVDIDPLLSNPHEAKSITEWFVDQTWAIRDEDPDYSLDYLAFIQKPLEDNIGVIRLAAAISMGASLSHIIVQQGKELPSQRIKYPSATPIAERFPNYSFAMLTDHCTTGNEVLQSIDDVEASGGKVRHLLTYSLNHEQFLWEEFEKREIAVHNFFTL